MLFDLEENSRLRREFRRKGSVSFAPDPSTALARVMSD
jgi:hypothetical protein